MRVAVITNPRSGRGQGPARGISIVRELLARGHQVEAHEGNSREDAEDWAKHAAKDADRLLVVGGDGSLSAVIAGLPEQHPPLMQAPLGTGNVLAKEFKVPQDPTALAEMAETGQVQALDLAHVNERLAFMVWGFGLDGEIIRRLEEKRSGTMHVMEYIPLLASALTGFSGPLQRVWADGEDLGEGVYGVVSGIQSYGTTALRLGTTLYDDGLWDLFLFRKLDAQTVANAAGHALLGSLQRSGVVEHRQVRSVKVEGPPIACQIDGDFGGTTPVDFHLSGRQLQLFIPRQ